MGFWLSVKAKGPTEKYGDSLWVIQGVWGCVYIYICMYVCMDGWMDGWMDGCMDVCMYVCMYVCGFCA